MEESRRVKKPTKGATQAAFDVRMRFTIIFILFSILEIIFRFFS